MKMKMQIKMNNKKIYFIILVFFLFVNCKKNNISNIDNISNIKTITTFDKKINVDNVDSVFFGNYYFDNSNEKNKIEWVVLDIDKQNKKALLLSKNILDNKCYNDDGNSCVWSDSSLRQFLNNDFYNNCFDDNEKEKIIETELKNEDNDFYEMVSKGGEQTKDKIFCLSINEMCKYFGEGTKNSSGFEIGNIINSKPSKYALSVLNDEEKLFVDENDFSYYWLRSPGHYQNTASVVDVDGVINTFGYSVDYKIIGIRPAMWVSFK